VKEGVGHRYWKPYAGIPVLLDLNFTSAQSFHDGMNDVDCVELVADVALVTLDGVRRYPENTGYVVCRFPLRAPLQQLALPRRQGRSLIVIRFALHADFAKYMDTQCFDQRHRVGWYLDAVAPCRHHGWASKRNMDRNANSILHAEFGSLVHDEAATRCQTADRQLMPEEWLRGEAAARGARIVMEVPFGLVASEPLARPSVMQDRTLPFSVGRYRQSGDRKTVQAITLENPLKYGEGTFR